MKQMTGRARYWETVVGEHGQSGMTIKAFCADRGLSEPSFYWWRRKLRQFSEQQGGDGGRSEGFVQLVAAGQRPATATPGIVLQVDGRISILLSPGFDRDTLRSALSVVWECGLCWR